MSTLFYADDGMLFSNLRFENDVKMYGAQTEAGIELPDPSFENDVKMYGAQTYLEKDKRPTGLRMM